VSGFSRTVIYNLLITIQSSLNTGLRIKDKAGREIVYRYLSVTDDVEEITEMLHDAYAPLKAAGMNFVASHQDAETTKRRMAAGETIVAVGEGGLVGVITLREAARTRGSPFYDRPDVALFGQFAVRPAQQRSGIGSNLISLVEQRAEEKGVGELALDTSERAVDLIALYERKGYRFVEYIQWPDVNYRSMIFAKRLHE
jgi:GNAT superfamily N-acetyltransferase